ncbi:MAG: serine/threonine-protein kinase [Acidobacteria bacterium]|nr:MAG: serine/threonine-protein kinase [Acidobacteriota bacterium]
MKIEPGQDLLHYRFVEKIGEGGMGVVWKAVDTTLNRDVAIKILPEGFSGEGERLVRFEREAKLLASLNHPNIAGIYGIHKSADMVFLSMELIDGEDLQKRLSRGALSRDDALNYALQIAHAFEAAHESGVIHRDLKPANVRLTPEGKIKVLDFGLAKALSQDPSGPGASPAMSPTLTSTGTIAGMVLGTAAYMSPEQAKGKVVDRRADIWSFGVVLFEMLSGRRLFEGEGISETLAAVIMKDIDWGGLPADTPRTIRRLLERCLQRDPKSRLRDIGDARIAIEEALRAPAEPELVTPATQRRPRWVRVLPWGITVAALAALGWVGWFGGKAAPPSPIMRFAMPIAEEQPLVRSPIPLLAISPDGRRIAYVGRNNNDRVIFLRHAHQSEAQPLKGTEGADNPFFSPDGEWIGFEADGKLKKVSVLGGPPMTLCDAPHLRGASWGTDGTIVFTPRRTGGLARVSEAGGEPESLTLIGAEDGFGQPSDRWPDLLPGNRVVILTSTQDNGNYSEADIVALSLADKSRKTLVKGGTFGRFVPPGFLVYARENTLFAARFDPEALELTGPAVPVLEEVSGAANYGSKHLAFSNNGTLLYLIGASDFDQESLVWISRDGTEEPASAHERDYGWAGVSPDGKHLALQVHVSNTDATDIWVLEMERDTLTRLTFQETLDIDPVWSPDGEWITFGSMPTEEGKVFNLYRMRADGTGETQRLTTSDRRQTPGAWSPDGTVLAFTERGGDPGLDLMLYRPGTDPEVEVFLATNFNEWQPGFSPDGRWISFASDMSGQPEIYVRSSTGSGQQVRISTEGGTIAVWNPVGKELFYRSLAGKLMSVSFTVEDDAFRPALPEELFDFSAPPYSFVFDVAPAGDRILAYKDLTGGEVERREPVVVINWIDELEAKVPAAR